MGSDAASGDVPPEVACSGVPVLSGERRLLGGAALARPGAARSEAASRGWRKRARHVALQDDALFRRGWIGHRDGGEKGARVRMARLGEEPALVGELDDL